MSIPAASRYVHFTNMREYRLSLTDCYHRLTRATIASPTVPLLATSPSDATRLRQCALSCGLDSSHLQFPRCSLASGAEAAPTCEVAAQVVRLFLAFKAPTPSRSPPCALALSCSSEHLNMTFWLCARANKSNSINPETVNPFVK